MDSVRGQLLLATPQLTDPNFSRSVVLVVDHNEEGALGVVINRATDARAAEAAPPLEVLVGHEDLLYVGGPVQADSIVVMAEFSDPGQAAVLATGSVGLLSADTDMDEAAGRVLRARAYAGFAGWGPDQLDGELDRDDWIVAPARPQDVFTGEPGELWGGVLGRLGPKYALVSKMPVDPRMN